LIKWEVRTAQCSQAALAPSLTIPLYNRSASTVISYVGQLCDPPDDLAKKEACYIERTVKIAHNSLPKFLPAKFKELGLPSCHSVVIRGQAARERCARKTCSTWRGMAEELEKSRKEHGPLKNLAAAMADLVDYDWWKARAYADVLKEAFNRSARCEPPPGGSLQRTIYSDLLGKATPSEAVDDLCERLRHFLTPSQLDDTDLKENIKRTIGRAKDLSPSAAWGCIKVWCNSGTTSFRCRNSKRACLFGCPQHFQDRMSHYAVCHSATAAMNKAARGRIQCVPDLSVLEGFGVSSALSAETQVFYIAMKTEMYNSLKHGDHSRPYLPAEPSSSSDSDSSDSSATSCSSALDRKEDSVEMTVNKVACESLARVFRAANFRFTRPRQHICLLQNQAPQSSEHSRFEHTGGAL